MADQHVLTTKMAQKPDSGLDWLTELQPLCMANAVPESRLQNQSGNWSSVGLRDG